VIHLDRQADGGDDLEVTRGFHDSPERCQAGVQQRALVEQVVRGVRREPELREQDDDGPIVGSTLHHLDGALGVEGRVRDPNLGDGDRDADKLVTVQIEEALASRHAAVSSRVGAARRRSPGRCRIHLSRIHP
jgi:hypothetical protein